MIKVPKIFKIFCFTIFLVACSEKKSNQKAEIIPVKPVRLDTLKRNDNIVYNVTKDTLIGDLQIAVTNKNIYEKYIHQDFYLNDSILIQNFYPEMETTIRIERNHVIFFEKSYLKNHFPKGTFSRFINNTIIKDFRFLALGSDNNDLIFMGTLYIPNTDFENDFQLIVSQNGKSKLVWIDYESED